MIKKVTSSKRRIIASIWLSVVLLESILPVVDFSCGNFFRVNKVIDRPSRVEDPQADTHTVQSKNRKSTVQHSNDLIRTVNLLWGLRVCYWLYQLLSEVCNLPIISQDKRETKLIRKDQVFVADNRSISATD